MPRGSRPSPSILIAVSLLAILALGLSSWLSDDSYISLRTIDNFLHGRGLTWNVAERVQVYTHPLWLFLAAGLAAVIGKIETAVLILSALFSLLTLWFVYRVSACDRSAGLAVVLLLLLSKSYVDYTSSGLENPLTRLLLVLFVWVWLGLPDAVGRLKWLSLLAALATLSRPDALLFFIPCLVLAVKRTPSIRTLLHVVMGFLPLAAWALFALFYYGTPFPNTAYAKLGLVLPRWRIVGQGLVYLADSLLRDPVTLLTLGLATWVVAQSVRRVRSGPDPATEVPAPQPLIPLLAGAWLYLLYVVWIGADFMSGRLLDGPFLLATLVLARYRLPERARAPIWTVILATGLLLFPRVIVPFLESRLIPSGVTDERRLYHPFTGAVYSLGNETWPDHTWRLQGERLAAEGERVFAHFCVGMMGYFGGPNLFLVDQFGLTDPLLARLPELDQGKEGLLDWRPGHNLRGIPRGYIDGLRQGRNGIEDPDLAAYYDVVRFVTRGDLWDIERLKTAIRWQVGDYDHYLESYLERLPSADDPPDDPSADSVEL